ncbi:MAG: delta-lactam-biosynthetic de-N-acetylase [Monoglobales bacterium]
MKIKKFFVCFFLVLLLIFTCSCGTQTSGNVSENLNRRKMCWGLKRNPGGVPDINPGELEILSAYDGIYLGDTKTKSLYLTFDEGYENGYTARILDILKKYNVPACFFVTGPYLKKETDLIFRMVNEGHDVGNHTVNHPSMPSLSEEEIEQELLGLERIFFENTGKTMKFLRPPMGEHSEKSMYCSKKLGYKTVFWTIAYEDWNVDKQPSSEFVYKSVMDNLHSGAVILMHAVSKTNAETLERIIVDAIKQGYTFKSLTTITT